MRDLFEAIRDDFDAETVARGVGYYRQGRVGRYRLEGETLIAAVRGEATYQVQITLVNLRLGPQRIQLDLLESDCDCPVGIQCKHGVAALLVWAAGLGLAAETMHGQGPLVMPQRAPAARPPPPQRFDVGPVTDKAWGGTGGAARWWLNRLREPVKAPVGTEHALIYVLNQDADTQAVTLELIASRVLKSGRLGILKRYRDPHQILERTPDFITSEDRSLLAELALPPESVDGRLWSAQAVIESGTILDRLLTSGRAAWGAVDGPRLTAGPERALAWTWIQDGKQGLQRLQLIDAGGVAVSVLPTSPLRYREGATIGPVVVTGCDDEMAALVYRMPWLHPVEAGLAAPHLAARGVRIPPPQAPEPQMPACELHVRDGAVRWQHKEGFAQRVSPLVVVVFRYGKVAVGENGPAIIEHAGKPVLRHERHEQDRLAELDRLGLRRWLTDQRSFRTVSLVTDLIVRVPEGVEKAPAEQDIAISSATLVALTASGWRIVGTDVPEVRILALDAVAVQVEEGGDGDWFELQAGMEVDGERVDLVPLLTPLLKGGKAAWERIPRAADDPPAVLVTVGSDRVLRVGLELLATLHDQLIELFDRPLGPGGGWTIDAARADLVDAIEHLSPRWIGGERLRALADRLRSCLAPPLLEPPAELNAELRTYQREGFSWLRQLFELGLGGILADDMGLGKTVQAIAHLLAGRAVAEASDLVVCPASMVGVWRQELTRFAPSLRVAVVHGAGRQAVTAAEGDVIITSHATLARDATAFASRAWQIVICDEAQALKNRSTKLASAIRTLDARQRLCLTGTPVENHLGELHALLSWAVPGVLGSEAAFTRTFRDPIEQGGDPARAALLRRRIAPFLLRRTKQAVASELPPRTDIDLPVTLGRKQRQLYETIRLTMDERVRAAVADRGLARSGMEVIEALLRLRQVCCDPRLIPTELAKRCEDSAKLDALRDLLTTLIEEGRPTLVFSQFTSLLDLVESEVLRDLNVPWLRLDGQSRDREDLVNRFQAGEAGVFLLSLKAGGTGLTLTRADSVVLLDPWWNPAVERQAADRAHRIGQLRPVTVYRLVATGTVEERIRALQARKAALADALVGEDGQALGRLSVEDIDALLAPLDEPE